MMLVAVLSFAFIFGVLFLSFVGAEPEEKVFGLTFFISFIIVGPLFGGMLSIHAPIPMDSENTIDVVSIVISLIIAGIALGLFKFIEEIKYRYRRKKLEEQRNKEQVLRKKK